MIEQLLLWLDDTPGARSAARWALDLARIISARVYAIYILPEPEPVPRTKRSLPVTNLPLQPAPSEERAWAVLYEVEDEAFERDVRISLLLEAGEPLARLKDVCVTYKTDLVVVSADCPLPVEKIVNQLPGPVVFVKPEKSFTRPARANMKED